MYNYITHCNNNILLELIQEINHVNFCFIKLTHKLHMGFIHSPFPSLHCLHGKFLLSIYRYLYIMPSVVIYLQTINLIILDALHSFLTQNHQSV